MYLFLVILMVVAAILMCFIVLIQNSKGGGLASGFSSSNEILGVRKTTDVLEKLTWGLAVFMVIASIATAYVVPSASQQESAKKSNLNSIAISLHNVCNSVVITYLLLIV